MMNLKEIKISVFKSESEFDNAAAWSVISQMLDKPNSVIGLSTGRTTGNMHRIIADIYKSHPFKTNDITFFGVDEITNVPLDYYGACYTMLKKECIDDLKIADKNFLMLPTESNDYTKSCKEFVNELEKRGGIDLIVLGLGENGHLGFNQPNSPFEIDAWVTNMNPELEARVNNELGEGPKYRGVTLGIKSIMRAKKIILLAKGANKSVAVKCMLRGEVSSDFPASILQLHPNCHFILDSNSAALLAD